MTARGRDGFRTPPKRIKTRPLTRIDFKVFTPDLNSYQTFSFKALPGEHYTQAEVEDMKAQMSEMLSSLFPAETFHFVPLGRNQFNVLHRVGNA